MNDPLQLSLSEADEARFGIRTAKASEVAAATLPSVLEFCRTNAVRFLIARCRVVELDCAQAMERAGFQLMDTLVYLARQAPEAPLPLGAAEIEVRPLRPGEEEAVRQIAAEAFRGYFGHYHADPRLDREKCDQVYVSWAVSLCRAVDASHEVHLARLAGVPVGFGARRLNTPDEGEAVMAGVLPQAHGRGVYRALLLYGLNWCARLGAKRMLISTQIQNTAVQRVAARLGFEPSHAYYTFHKWFD